MEIKLTGPFLFFKMHGNGRQWDHKANLASRLTCKSIMQAEQIQHFTIINQYCEQIPPSISYPSCSLILQLLMALSCLFLFNNDVGKKMVRSYRTNMEIFHLLAT